MASRDRNSSSKWNFSKHIAFWGLIINAALAIVTFLLFTLNKTSTKAATDSAIAAVKADSLTKVYSDSSLKIQHEAKISADSDNRNKRIADGQTFALQQKGLKQQITSIKVTQKQFEIESRPFLAIGGLAADTMTLGKKLNYSVSIFNSGKLPAIIIRSQYTFKITHDTAYKDFKGISEITGQKNSFVANNQSFPFFGDAGPITQQILDSAAKKPFFLYFLGYIKYRSVVASKIYSAKFSYRIDFSPRHEVKIVYYNPD